MTRRTLQLTLQYIFHDCFLLTTEEANVVFDFWQDPLPEKGELPLFLRGLPKDKPLYVFVSHHHKDHYVKEIFDWNRDFPHIHYVLSHDTAKFARHILSPTSTYAGTKPNPDSVTVLKPGETYSDSLLTVKAYGSTDIGNSYALQIGGMSVFHAGDLNAWIWKDESTPEEVDQALKDFNVILDDIAVDFQGFDIAMFPVDSRIGTDYFTGAQIFTRRLDVARFFPMHFALGDTSEERLRHRLDAVKAAPCLTPREFIALQSPYSLFLRKRRAKKRGEESALF